MTVPRVHIYRIRTDRQFVSRPQCGAGPRLRNDEPAPRDHAGDTIPLQLVSCVHVYECIGLITLADYTLTLIVSKHMTVYCPPSG
jgi:hypothetical protein